MSNLSKALNTLMNLPEEEKREPSPSDQILARMEKNRRVRKGINLSYEEVEHLYTELMGQWMSQSYDLVHGQGEE